MTGQPAALTGEVISIGDEMTSGARLDTNSQWLSQQLVSLGIRPEYHTTVGDRLSANVQVLQTAAERADVIVTTGGLGPTQDDLTREAIALAIDQPLEFRQAAFDHIVTLFSSRGRAMPERNRVQAMFPRGSREIPNPQGTAPGIDVQWKPAPAVSADSGSGRPQRAARLFALPGVPAEMYQMWDQTVAPRLVEEMGAGRRKIRQHVVKCFGVGESEMERRLEGLIARDQTPSVGITVSRATISLRITAEADDEAVCDALIATARERIFRAAGEYVFGEGEDYELQHAVAERLASRGESLVVLEVGVGGVAGGWLEGLQRPELFRAQLHAPDRAAMARLLDQPSDAPAAIVRTACQRSQADWGLLIDDYPILNASNRPLPAHPISITVVRASDGRTDQSKDELGGHPDIIKDRIAKAALDFFRRQLT